MAVALDKRGDSLDVIEIAGKGSPYAFAGKESINRINWHILFPESSPEDLDGKQIQQKLYPLLDVIKPDVIIAGAIAYPSGALAVNYAMKHGCKVIIFDDAKNEAVKRNGITNRIKQAVYSGVDAMFYPAPEWIPTGDSWGFRESQMFFGVDVVDNDFWSNPRCSNNPYGNYLVTVGRQIPKKNFLRIAEAYLKYTESVGKRNAMKLVMIGEGPEHNRIEDIVKTHDLSDKLIMLPFKSQDELASIYQNAKALICCSDITETWGLVINEAMACNCAIITSTECGAASPLVRGGVNGFVFGCHDVDALTDKMIEFHNLGESRQSAMGKKSSEIISQWGLDKFCNGAMKAIDFVTENGKRNVSLINKLIISLWKGRYRPV